MKPRLLLGWILVATGLLFLISGLIVTTSATIAANTPRNLLQSEGTSPPTAWVQFADQVMDFTVELLSMDWTPTRVGIFFIIIGMLLEGTGVYALISATK